MNAGSNAASRGMAVHDRIRLTGSPAKYSEIQRNTASSYQLPAASLQGSGIRDQGSGIRGQGSGATKLAGGGGVRVAPSDALHLLLAVSTLLWRKDRVRTSTTKKVDLRLAVYDVRTGSRRMMIHRSTSSGFKSLRTYRLLSIAKEMQPHSVARAVYRWANGRLVMHRMGQN
jgi:hypothetical protein